MNRTRKYLRSAAALTLGFLVLLPPFSLSLKAAPEEAEEASTETEGQPQLTDFVEDHDEIEVVSVTVNINSGNNEVFTELLLRNTAEEPREVTFELPEISAGMNVDSLAITGPNGAEVIVSDGIVTLSAEGGAYTGISYVYQSKKRISYEHTVLFDLTQLSDSFGDRIGHLEWTADLPLSELILVTEVEPVNYTVAENRIRVVLDDFSVTPLLNRVSYSQVTYTDLIDQQDSWETLVEQSFGTDEEWLQEWREYLKEEVSWDGFSGAEAEAEIERRLEYRLDQRKQVLEKELFYLRLNRFILENYRKWYRTPHFEKYFVLQEGFDWETDEPISDELNPGLTLLKLYLTLEEHVPKKDVEAIIDFTTSHGVGEYGDLIDRYGFERIQRYSEFRYWFGVLVSGEHIFTNLLRTASLSSGVGQMDPTLYDYCDISVSDTTVTAAALAAQMYPKEPSVYVILLPDSIRNDKRMVSHIGMTFKYSDTDELYLGELHLAASDEYQAHRVIFLYEEDCEDPEWLSDYLRVLNVKALMRSDFYPDDLPMEQKLIDYYMRDTLGWEDRDREDAEDPSVYYTMYFSYSGTERYPYETLEEDLKFSVPEEHPVRLFRREDPLAERFPIPVYTQYWGLRKEAAPDDSENLRPEYQKILDRDYVRVSSFPDNTLFNWYYLNYEDYEKVYMMDRFLDRPIPKQMIAEREQALQALQEEHERLSGEVRDTLALPKAPEIPIPKFDPEEEEPEEEPEEETETENEVSGSAGSKTEDSDLETAEGKPREAKDASAEGEESFAEPEEPLTPGSKVLWIVVITGCSVITLIAAAAVTMLLVRKKK